MSNLGITTFIEIQDQDGDYLEVEVTASYDYQPYEPMVRYYPDGTGYPGCDAQVEGIYDIECVEEDPNLVRIFDNWIETGDNLAHAESTIEHAIWKYIEENGEPC